MTTLFWGIHCGDRRLAVGFSKSPSFFGEGWKLMKVCPVRCRGETSFGC